MNRLDGMKQQRTKIIEDQRALYDKAEAENRTLTAEEQVKFDKLDQDFDNLTADIERLTVRMNSSHLDVNRFKPIPEGQHRAIRGEVRFLKPDEKFRENPQTPYSLGDFIVGKATGRWIDGELRGMSEGTDSAGGYLVPDVLAETIIDRLRPFSVLTQAGALRVVVEHGNLKIPRVTTDPVAYWRAENTAITESDPAFDAVNLEPKAVAGLIRISLELLQDSPTAGQVVEQLLLKAISAEIDRVGLVGSGSGAEPTGLFTDSDVETYSMGTNGAALTGYSPLSQAIQTLQENNVEPGAVIMAPRTAGTLDRLVDGSGQPLQPLPSFSKLKRLVTSNIPVDQTQGTASNATFVCVGDFSNLVIGFSPENMRVDVSKTTDDVFGKMQCLIRCYARVDFGILRPSAFCNMVGIIS